MSGRQLAEWQAYAQLEPFGSPAQFWQAGLIASVLANVNRTKKDQKAFTPEDFMPRSMVEQGEPESPDDVGARIMQTFQSLAELPQGTLEP
jgi:hypothetical protein